jgi:HD-GYP domain-containing protein (c-di-GMP phosphodiesterase class II)
MAAALDAPARIDLDPELDELIATSRTWSEALRTTREQAPGLVSGSAFFLAALAIALVFPAVRAPSFWVYPVCIAAYALASRVQFEIGPGNAVPTALVFVPMLFVLPLRTVALCVAAGLILGHPSQLTSAPLRLANGWHCLAPVLVLAAAGAPAPTMRHATAFVLALGAQFVFDFVSTATLEWLRVGLSPRTLARFMVWTWGVDAALAGPGLAFAAVAVSAPAAIVLVLPLIGLLAVFAQERRSRIDHALELSHAYRGTALLLGDVVEADDAYTGSHSRDVVGLVLAVADRLGLDARERRNAEFAALLHDVGKVRVPAEIVNKKGPLDDAERALMRLHTVEGERMLERVGGLLGDVGRVVRSCHEDFDGSGYPDGLAGEAIPLVARIVAACDAYSAMTTDRSYRKAMTHAAAVVELRRCAGTQFDPRVVEVLCKVAETVARER